MKKAVATFIAWDDGTGEWDRTPAALDVIDERRRQVEAEGWTPEHDDKYQNNELPDAAACYALTATRIRGAQLWPWAMSWWKPTTARRNLVKACALILAEIERIDRAIAPRPDAAEKKEEAR